ncbi:MAG: type VI secretion system tip protein VgrG [Saprospiraceae bacterium]
MNNSLVIPNNSTYDLPSFDILSEGRAIDSGYQVYYFEMVKMANKIPYAKLALRDGNAAEGTFEITDSDTFRPGKKIEIKAGYDQNNETIFKGVVVKQRLKIGAEGLSVLYVDCRDEAFKTTLGRKNKYFEDVKDSDAIEEILSAYGLAGDVAATSVQHKELIQFHATDWDFILCRAEANGMLVFANDGKVNVAVPSSSGSPALQLGFGGNLLEFEAEMDARTQWKKAVAKSWNYAAQSPFEAESSGAAFTENGSPSGSDLADVGAPDSYDLRHSGHLPEDELGEWAKSCMMKSRLAKVRGRARFRGFANILPGQVVKLEGVGDRFNGNVYVTGVRYEMIEGACFGDLQFGMDPRWVSHEQDLVDHPASGVMPGVNGLQIGKVIQLEGDPDGEDRILVKLPIVDPDGAGAWTRLASLDAGNNRGWVIRPEIDDEVIVGFINDDPRDAVVLGMLHSSSHPAPIPAADDNHIKGYTSRSEMKVEFDDDQKIIVISTPAGNNITITEAGTAIEITDQNGNEYKMNPDGISLKSPADIKLEATGNISIKATGDLSMEGMNVKGKANVQMKMEGSASAEFSAGGQTAIKGGMVMIN